MKNKLHNLNDYLFAEIERVMECANDSKGREKLKTELDRAKTMTGLSNSIISNAKTQLAAVELAYELHLDKKELPEVLQKKPTLMELMEPAGVDR